MILGASLALLIAAVLFLSNKYVENKANGKVYDYLKDLPANQVGLVLGTSRIMRNGRMNPYFQYRVQAAAELYHSGKIKYLIVSGDNSRREYDEATDMRDELVRKGVPKDHIYMDYAGFRTLDSIVRCNKIFGQSSFTIISQKFHNQRAVFLADSFDLEAVGYNCRDLTFEKGKWVIGREYLARLKAVLDVITGKKPRFLGEQITIGLPQTDTND